MGVRPVTGVEDAWKHFLHALLFLAGVLVGGYILKNNPPEGGTLLDEIKAKAEEYKKR